MIVLASASPRRRALLEAAGLSFVIRASDADESVAPGTSALEAAVQLAERKARAVAEASAESDAWFLGADTIVVLGSGAREVLLGKPAGEEDAHAMLEQLSDSTHRVITGVAVLGPRGSAADACTTTVTMRSITPREISAYVASGEWRDKAGGYAIQETADRFVTSLEGGGFDNVVGLPVDLALELLRGLGAPVPEGAGGGQS